MPDPDKPPTTCPKNNMKEIEKGEKYEREREREESGKEKERVKKRKKKFEYFLYSRL